MKILLYSPEDKSENTDSNANEGFQLEDGELEDGDQEERPQKWSHTFEINLNNEKKAKSQIKNFNQLIEEKFTKEKLTEFITDAGKKAKKGLIYIVKINTAGRIILKILEVDKNTYAYKLFHDADKVEMTKVAITNKVSSFMDALKNKMPFFNKDSKDEQYNLKYKPRDKGYSKLIKKLIEPAIAGVVLTTGVLGIPIATIALAGPYVVASLFLGLAPPPSVKLLLNAASIKDFIEYADELYYTKGKEDIIDKVQNQEEKISSTFYIFASDPGGFKISKSEFHDFKDINKIDEMMKRITFVEQHQLPKSEKKEENSYTSNDHTLSRKNTADTAEIKTRTHNSEENGNIGQSQQKSHSHVKKIGKTGIGNGIGNTKFTI